MSAFPRRAIMIAWNENDRFAILLFKSMSPKTSLFRICQTLVSLNTTLLLCFIFIIRYLKKPISRRGLSKTEASIFGYIFLRSNSTPLSSSGSSNSLCMDCPKTRGARGDNIMGLNSFAPNQQIPLHHGIFIFVSLSCSASSVPLLGS